MLNGRPDPMVIPKAPEVLVGLFRDQQGVMILILGILLLGTVAAAIGKSPKWQFIFSAAIIAYALVAFLVAVTLVTHGGKP